MGKTVIVSGARTPFGKFGGGLQPLSAAQLGGIAIREAINRANIADTDIDELIFGNVLQGGQGQIPSRQASREAGLPWELKTETINKVCASGLRSITLADQIIRAGDAEVVVAGGMESMSNAPYFVKNARWGARMGATKFDDLMIHDGLTCSFTGAHMGTYGDSVAAELGLTRQEQDEWSFRSHDLAVKAIESGKFAEEIVNVSVPQRKGDPVVISNDESPRPSTTVEVLSKLKPVFSKEGTITAGNAPGINDGAAALIIMDEECAKRENREILATIVAHEAMATEAKDFPKTPGYAINNLLQKTGKTADDVKLYEINEAFAAVALASIKIANLDPNRVNVNGGAVALGHPIGASGARIVLTLIHELRRQGGGLGVAAICSGGGQGDAIMVEV